MTTMSNLKNTVSIFWGHATDNEFETSRTLYNKVYDEVIPAYGEADTIGGELLRAASKLQYEIHNNGFGANNVAGYALYLKNYLNAYPEFVADVNLVYDHMCCQSAWKDNLEPLIIMSLDKIIMSLVLGKLDANNELHSLFEVKNSICSGDLVSNDDFFDLDDGSEDEDYYDEEEDY